MNLRSEYDLQKILSVKAAAGDPDYQLFLNMSIEEAFVRMPSKVDLFLKVKEYETAYPIERIMKAVQELTALKVAREQDAQRGSAPEKPKRNYPKRRKERESAKANRAAIFNFVKDNPTATDEEIGLAVGLKLSAVKKHLKILRSEGFIKNLLLRTCGVINAAGSYKWSNIRTIVPLK